MDTRRHVARWGAGQPRKRTSEAYWKQPLRWNARDFYQCKTCGWRGEPADDQCPSCSSSTWTIARRRVFCASLADWLDNEVPIEWLVDLLDLIRCTPDLDWLLLTKRIGNFGRIMTAAMVCAEKNDGLRGWIVDWYSNGKPPKNVWLGATVVNQAEAERDVPKLLKTIACTRFLSCEPLLGPIDLLAILAEPTGRFRTHGGKRQMELTVDARPDWVIAGGESGPDARPMHPSWTRKLRDQCAMLETSFLFKQWGEWRPPLEGEEFSTANGRAQRTPAFIVENNGHVHCFQNERHADPVVMLRVGKKKAGRTLDGREHNEFPSAA